MSITQKEATQFFATKSGKPNVVKQMDGLFKFKNLNKKIQEKIKKRLAEKDEVVAQGLRGILPGLKIDGKVVTRENIHDFEISKMRGKVAKPKAKKELKKAVKVEKYTKKELQAILDKEGLKGLRKVGKKLGIKFRGFKEAIKEILEVQK